MKKLRIFIILILFGSSCFIYLFNRENIILYDWLNLNSLQNFELFNVFTFNIPKWIVYNLPDGIWTMTMTYAILYIWNFRITKMNVFWIILPFILAFSIEFGQQLKLINGTYDTKDLVFIFIGYIIPLIETLKINHYEKSIY